MNVNPRWSKWPGDSGHYSWCLWWMLYICAKEEFQYKFKTVPMSPSPALSQAQYVHLKSHVLGHVSHLILRRWNWSRQTPFCVSITKWLSFSNSASCTVYHVWMPWKESYHWIALWKQSLPTDTQCSSHIIRCEVSHKTWLVTHTHCHSCLASDRFSTRWSY